MCLPQQGSDRFSNVAKNSTFLIDNFVFCNWFCNAVFDYKKLFCNKNTTNDLSGDEFRINLHRRRLKFKVINQELFMLCLSGRSSG